MEPALHYVKRDDDLRYVAQHFADMQGLRMAPLWAVLMLQCTLKYAHSLSLQQGGLLSLGLLALSLAWLVYAGRWYSRRYGVVTPREERVPSQVLSIFNIHRRTERPPAWWFALWALVSASFLADMFQPRLGRPFGGFQLVLAILLLQKASFTDGVSRSTRGRQMLAIGGIVLICAINCAYLLGYLSPWLCLDASGMVLLWASLYDHWLLTRLLSGRSTEGGDA